MSANNWRECPACLAKSKARMELLRASIRRKYGKVDADEYEAFKSEREKEIAAEEQAGEESVFREDYQIGVASVDGDKPRAEFYMIYRGECQRCGFAVKREIEEAIELPKE